jgi:AcrR family transcriptional regulator
VSFFVDMKDARPESLQKRPYRMRARAEAAAETGWRILEATIELHRERFFDQVSLEDIAERAGVTVRTVIRRFGSKERLIEAAAEEGARRVTRQRFQVPIGDIEGAVNNLVDHYEEWADSALRLLAQEERVAAFRPITDAARALHHEWVERTFAPLLAKRTGEERQRLSAELIAVCDVYFWKLLRRDMGLSREQTELAIRETILALKGEA